MEGKALSQAPSFPLFIDAYLADTTHLSTEEHGAYLLLLMAMWRRGGSVPDDDTDNARIIGLSPRRWREVKTRLCPFLVLADGEISQKRLKSEWEYIERRRAAASVNGALGGRPRTNKNNDITKANGSSQLKPDETVTKASQPHTHQVREDEGVRTPLSEDEPSDPKPKSRKRGTYPEAFETLWRSYPTDRLMSKKQALTAWQRMDEEARGQALRSVPAFRAYCAQHKDYRPIHLVRYLTQERYVGFNEAAAKAVGQIFVAKDSEPWFAWQRVKPTAAVKSESGRVGWWFPSEWPPQGAIAA